MKVVKGWAFFDEMSWPVASAPEAIDAEWKLRHAPETVTRADQLRAASIMSAYRELIGKPERARAKVIRALRTAAK